MLIEISQSQKDKDFLISLIRGIYNSFIHRVKEQNGHCQEVEGRENVAFLINGHQVSVLVFYI